MKFREKWSGAGIDGNLWGALLELVPHFLFLDSYIKSICTFVYFSYISLSLSIVFLYISKVRYQF